MTKQILQLKEAATCMHVMVGTGESSPDRMIDRSHKKDGHWWWQYGDLGRLTNNLDTGKSLIRTGW